MLKNLLKMLHNVQYLHNLSTNTGLSKKKMGQFLSRNTRKIDTQQTINLYKHQISYYYCSLAKYTISEQSKCTTKRYYTVECLYTKIYKRT